MGRARADDKLLVAVASFRGRIEGDGGKEGDTKSVASTGTGAASTGAKGLAFVVCACLGGP